MRKSSLAYQSPKGTEQRAASSPLLLPSSPAHHLPAGSSSPTPFSTSLMAHPSSTGIIPVLWETPSQTEFGGGPTNTSSCIKSLSHFKQRRLRGTRNRTQKIYWQETQKLTCNSEDPATTTTPQLQPASSTTFFTGRCCPAQGGSPLPTLTCHPSAGLPSPQHPSGGSQPTSAGRTTAHHPSAGPPSSCCP